eukprot:6184821-Pleurochrysis_carterae.AAC.3
MPAQLVSARGACTSATRSRKVSCNENAAVDVDDVRPCSIVPACLRFYFRKSVTRYRLQVWERNWTDKTCSRHAHVEAIKMAFGAHCSKTIECASAVFGRSPCKVFTRVQPRPRKVLSRASPCACPHAAFVAS